MFSKKCQAKNKRQFDRMLMLQMMPTKLRAVAFIGGTALNADSDAQQYYNWQYGFNITSETICGHRMNYLPVWSHVFRKKS